MAPMRSVRIRRTRNPVAVEWRFVCMMAGMIQRRSLVWIFCENTTKKSFVDESDNSLIGYKIDNEEYCVNDGCDNKTEQSYLNESDNAVIGYKIDSEESCVDVGCDDTTAKSCVNDGCDDTTGKSYLDESDNAVIGYKTDSEESCVDDGCNHELERTIAPCAGPLSFCVCCYITIYVFVCIDSVCI